MARIARIAVDPGCESLEYYNNFLEVDEMDPESAKRFIEDMQRRIEVSISDTEVDEIESVMISEEPLLHIYHHYATAKTRGKDFVFIFVYTNQESGRRIEPKETRKTVFQAYERPIQFFSPDYSQLQLPDEVDYRRTLYWNPNVELDENGNASVQFYNNGTCKDILIDAQGITSKGEFINRW